MKEYLGLLYTVSLFKDIKPAELETLLGCTGARIARAGKGEIILSAGDKPKFVGIVISGQIHVIRENYDGNRSLLAAVGQGGIFAEALCCAGVTESPVTVLASVDSSFLAISFADIPRTCHNSCAFHTKLIENMLKLIANKNLMIQARMEIISMRSIRAKVTRYLESLAVKQGKEIRIPFNREEMADFLCVERSALCHELARMKDEGLIEYRKNVFKLIV